MKGHVHQKLMAQYAEDAKTTDKPWELWQILTKTQDGDMWFCFKSQFYFSDKAKYRRKPKMKLIHGVEVPDIGITPEYEDMYYLADVYAVDLFDRQKATGRLDFHWASIGLCYPHTEDGKQAAILHAKAMLGIAP